MLEFIWRMFLLRDECLHEGRREKNEGIKWRLSNHLLDARCSAFSVPILTSSLRGKCPHYPDFTDEGNGGSGRTTCPQSHMSEWKGGPKLCALPAKFCCKRWYYCSRGKYLSDGVHGLNEMSSAYVRHVANRLRQRDHVRATLEGARRGTWSQMRPIAEASGNPTALGGGSPGSWPLLQLRGLPSQYLMSVFSSSA